MQWIKKHKFVMLVLFLLGCSLSLSFYLFHWLFEPISQKNTSIATVMEEEPENKTYNFLLLGVDQRDDDIGRADTIIVLSTNLATKRIGLISIPRDSRIEIPTHGETKINHSFAYGGVFLTQQMVEKVLGMKMDNYVVFNFQSFKKVIDILDGVDIDVEKDMYYRDDWDSDGGLLIDLKKGKQHLNGQHAMEFVRFRDEEGDIGRVRRQQQFLDAVMKKITSPEIILRLPALTKEILASIDTNIKFDDFITYIKFLRPGQKYDIAAVMAPGEPQMIDDLSYWILDKEALRKKLLDLNQFILGSNQMLAEEDKKTEDPDKQEKLEEKLSDKKLLADMQSGMFASGLFADKKSSLSWQQEEIIDVSEKKKEQIQKKILEDEARERATLEAQREAQQVAEIEMQRAREQMETRSLKANGIRIINTTKDATKADMAERALEKRGVDVGEISTSNTGKANSKTIFILASDDEKTKAILGDLPFHFTVMVRNGAGVSTLIIGDDI